MIADSRATWLGGGSRRFQDSLQKILSLGPRIAIGFAGDVQAAALVVEQLRGRMQKKPRLRILRKLAADVPRIAKHYYSLHRSRTGKDHPLDLVLGGVTDSGAVEIWWFQSPNFHGHKLERGFVVRGSGSVVAPYVQDNFERFDRELPNLKARADALISGLDGELQGRVVDTVGGLLQVILLGPDGIRPLRHGFISLNPEHPGDAMTMEMRAGRWFQRDLQAGVEIPLVEPAQLLRSHPAELRIHDYHPPSGELATPRWHLTYFVTCLGARVDVGTLEFNGVLSQIGSLDYPVSVNILAAVGLWGSIGHHEIEFSLIRDGDRQRIHTEAIHIQYLPEEADLAFNIPLHIHAPGPVFLECRIAGQLLARRALYFGRPTRVAPTTEARFTEYVRRQAEALTQEHRATSDPVLEHSGESALVYFSLCQSCTDQDMILRFDGQIRAVYWKAYPLHLRVFVATAFRMPRGEHRVRLDLVNAATRDTSTITTATVTSTSSCIVTPVHGELIVVVPAPGIYFVNVCVDDDLIGTALLPAETDRPEWSYTLMDAEEAQVAAGQLLLLLKRSRQQQD